MGATSKFLATTRVQHIQQDGASSHLASLILLVVSTWPM